MIKIKRVYDGIKDTDGKRFLVDRLWPRGLTKEAANIHYWFKEIAPSNELRKWFGHEEKKWTEFRARYVKELSDPGKKKILIDIAKEAATSTVTLVYGAKDEKHNNAVVLQDLVGKLTESKKKVTSH